MTTVSKYDVGELSKKTVSANIWWACDAFASTYKYSRYKITWAYHAYLIIRRSDVSQESYLSFNFRWCLYDHFYSSYLWVYFSSCIFIFTNISYQRMSVVFVLCDKFRCEFWATSLLEFNVQLWVSKLHSLRQSENVDFCYTILDIIGVFPHNIYESLRGYCEHSILSFLMQISINSSYAWYVYVYVYL